jgi:hypothetical protein
MQSGPREMYELQSAAFSARSELLGIVTDSTTILPPTHSPPNIVELCALKRRILNNLPTECGHCHAIYPPNSIVEHTGSVIGYCKLPGACGRSLILFAGVDMTCPVYQKICPFKAVEEEVIPVPSQSGNVSAAQVEQTPIFSQVQQQQSTFDVYALHGITRPNVVCSLCGITFQHHDHRKCDQNGWVETGRRYLELPSNWPVFNERTKTWSNL